MLSLLFLFVLVIFVGVLRLLVEWQVEQPTTKNVNSAWPSFLGTGNDFSQKQQRQRKSFV